jgi:sec-independent protein translocase protein TatA
MSLGMTQILLIVLLVALLFGAGRLPRMMEDLGKGIKSFRKGLNEGEAEEKPKELENSETEKEKE